VNGERWTKTDAATGDTTTYGYDDLGNLVRVDLPDGRRIDCLVDAANRRIGKKIDGALAQGFLWGSDGRIAAELDGAGAAVSRFVYATEGNAPDFMVKGGHTYRFVKDHLGSPRLVVDASNGAIAQRIDYNEFGVVVSETGSAFQPFGFAGGFRDDDVCGVILSGRTYDPETGTWTNRPVLWRVPDSGHVSDNDRVGSTGVPRSGFLSSRRRFGDEARSPLMYRDFERLHDPAGRLQWRLFPSGAVAWEVAARLPAQSWTLESLFSSLPFANPVNVSPADRSAMQTLPTLRGGHTTFLPGCNAPPELAAVCEINPTAVQFEIRLADAAPDCAGAHPHQPVRSFFIPILPNISAGWDLAADSALTAPADGRYCWRVRFDILGTASIWSTETSFVLDRTPPSVPAAGSASVNTDYFDDESLRSRNGLFFIWPPVSTDATGRIDHSGVEEYLVQPCDTTFTPASSWTRRCDLPTLDIRAADACSAVECQWRTFADEQNTIYRNNAHFSFQVAAVDAAGNVGEWSDESTFAIDVERPSVVDELSPYPCNAGSSNPWGNLSFGTSELEGAEVEGTDGKMSLRYENGILYDRRVLANCFSDSIEFEFEFFDTQPDLDSLFLRWGEGSYLKMTGQRTEKWFPVGPFQTGSLQSKPLRWTFASDFSRRNESRGFSVSKLRLGCANWCNPAQAIAHASERFDGYLQGPGDVIYLKVDSSTTRRIHLWGRHADSQHLFDLYARCNDDPTASAFDFRAAEPNSQQSIELPAGGCRDPDQDIDLPWHIAVHSRMGAGAFRLFVFDAPQDYDPGGDPPDELDVGISFNVDDATRPGARAAVEGTVMGALRQWYAATQGRVYPGPVARVWNNDGCKCGYPIPGDWDLTGTSCEVCFFWEKTVDDDTRSDCYLGPNTTECDYRLPIPPLPKGMVRLHRDDDDAPYWRWETLQHELGHCAFNLPDEYDNGQPGDPSECPHSIMGGSDHHMLGLCNRMNHYKDADVGATFPWCGSPENPTWDNYVRLGLPGAGWWGNTTQEYALFAGWGRSTGVDDFDRNGFGFTIPAFSVVWEQ